MATAQNVPNGTNFSDQSHCTQYIIITNKNLSAQQELRRQQFCTYAWWRSDPHHHGEQTVKPYGRLATMTPQAVVNQ
jgi:hypothetical protein